MWRKSDNIVHRLSNRQISAAVPNTHIHRARLLYENIVPNYTVYDTEYPDCHIKKFTNDGQYLICFSRNFQNLIVYRFNWLNYCNKGEDSDTVEEFPAKGRKFESYFSLLYSLNLASGNEQISKDVFLITDCNCYGIFATASVQVPDAPGSPGAVPGIPSIDKITFYLVRLRDGTIMDERNFYNDFIHLSRDVGIFMYDDLLSILSLRYQAIHILQVRRAGIFVDVRIIGPFCREDDELILHSHVREESLFQVQLSSIHKAKVVFSERDIRDSEVYDFTAGAQSTDDYHELDDTNGGLVRVPNDSLGNDTDFSVPVSHQTDQRYETTDHVFGGLKQRLLSYIFRSIEVQDDDPVVKAANLKRFYYNFQHYVDLLMWKVQFLDRHHLMIKFGGLDGAISQNVDASNQTLFFVVYNIESTEIIGFFQNSSEELLQLFENYHDYFRITPSYPLYMRFISSYSNNIFARQQFRKQKTACSNAKPSGSAQVIKRILSSSLPCSAQTLSPAAYFDQSLFQFDEKLISAADQYKPCLEPPIKFISRRKANVLKFKINPGHKFGPIDGAGKRVASFIFHPVFPFAISVQQAYMQPAIVNFHLRR